MALSDNLIHYWSLEESSGTRTDSAGSNNLTDGSSVGSTTGIQGDAADFASASTDYLTGTRVGHIEGVPISYNFWVNLPTTSQRGVFIEDSGNGGNNNGFAIGVGSGTLDTNGNNLIIPFWGVSWQDTGDTIGTGWHMITLLIASDRKCTAYMDGTLTYTGTSTMGVFSNSPFNIGRSNYAPAYRYLSDGTIDEVGIWDRALTGAEITELYNSGSGLSYADITGGGAPTYNALAFCPF